MQDCVIEFQRPQRTAFGGCVWGYYSKFRKHKDRKLLNPVKCQMFQKSWSTSQVNITSGQRLVMNIFLNNIHTLLNPNILNRDKHPGFLCITPPNLYYLQCSMLDTFLLVGSHHTIITLFSWSKSLHF